MKMKSMTGLAVAAIGAAVCGADGGSDAHGGEKGSLDIAPIVADGKGDIGRKANVLDELAPDDDVKQDPSPGRDPGRGRPALRPAARSNA